MICDNCKERESTTVIKRYINGKLEEIHLCDQCKQQALINNFIVGPIIDKISDQLNIQDDVSPERDFCPKCKHSFYELMDLGKLGCSSCYESFSDRLEQIFSGIQGEKIHRGKVPKEFEEKQKIEEKLNNLDLALKKAIEDERYEEAALIRDEISKIYEK